MKTLLLILNPRISEVVAKFAVRLSDRGAIGRTPARRWASRHCIRRGVRGVIRPQCGTVRPRGRTASCLPYAHREDSFWRSAGRTAYAPALMSIRNVLLNFNAMNSSWRSKQLQISLVALPSRSVSFGVFCPILTHASPRRALASET